MFTFFKYLFLIVLVIALGGAALIGWPLLTAVTQQNVENRIESGCLVAMVARDINNRQPRRNIPAEPIIRADCACVAADTVRTLGLPAATFAVEEARAQTARALGAALSGGGFSASRIPYEKAIEKLLDQSVKSLAICQKQRKGG